ncbi:hypothetical protein PR003_g7386 [Phytophthora rubi]|uniref:Uncharacterized protein n=1 Tax=Phytophthora rubi TaxID=129364 RepID=A0A6A4FJZ9_9STRA|nr:hypothetical protein PR003_g7386 [Phytophthora rubi]
MDPDKVQTINDWPVPMAQEELHSFGGLTGYIQRFCPDRIKKSYKKNRDVQAILAAIKKRKSILNTRSEHQQHRKYRYTSEANGLLWYQTPADDAQRIVVPNYVKLRQTIISECHDTNYGGHPGAERTYLTLARHWYRSKMLNSIKKFITDCEPCRMNKPRLTKHRGLLSIPDKRSRPTSMDFITDLLRTKQDVDFIWVVVDWLTKRFHFVPTTKKVNAEGVARLFIDNIWKLHGMPANIVSDRDRKFVCLLASCLQVHRDEAQHDRSTSRSRRRTVGAHEPNLGRHTKLALFEADLGYIPLSPLQLASKQLESVPKSQRGAEFHVRQAAILLRCREALAQAQERMCDVCDQNSVEQIFEVGDKVHLSTQHLDPKHSRLPNSTKFGPKWIGPYTVVRKIHNHAYELNIQAGNKLHPVFNTASLKPYKEPTHLPQSSDVILADGSIDQIVKALRGKRTRKRWIQYLVGWVGEEKQT